MNYDNNDPNWDPSKVILPNNPYEIDLDTGYGDAYIPSSTVLMDADNWNMNHQ